MNGRKTIRSVMLGDKKFTLRFPERGYLEDFLDHINSLVRERAYILWQKEFTMEEERKFLDDMLRGMSKGEKVALVAEHNGKVVAVASIEREKGDARRHVGKLGIGINAGCRGISLGQVMIESILELAINMLGLKIVKLDVFEENMVARRLYEKCGFKYAGRIDKAINHYGKFMASLIVVREL